MAMLFAARAFQRLRAPAAALSCAAGAAYYSSSCAEAPAAVGLDPAGWKKLTLTEKTVLSANSAIYRFAYDDPKATSGMTVASCLLTKANIGSEKPDGSRGVVLRPYTPITRPDVVGYLDLVVKAYPEGKMSKHIAEMKIGDKLDFKGPIVKLAYKPNQYKSIGMVAGGTGITPMLQVIDEILENKDDKTTVSLIYGNQTESDILMKKEIDARAAANPDKLKVYCIVDKLGSNPMAKMFWKGGVGYVTEETLKEKMPPPGESSMVYVCGPPPMYKAICGPKGTKEDPKAQGELGGLLEKMGYTSSGVFKF